MKVIDLLNKIAKGEEIPKKFKYAQQIFKKEGLRYIDEDGDDIFESIFNDFSNINDEIEIIEEEKQIKKLVRDDFYGSATYEITNKINEIIDVVNELKERIMNKEEI